MKKWLFQLVSVVWVTFLALYMGCGGGGGGKSSAQSQLNKLPPADISDPAVLGDAVGSAFGIGETSLMFAGGFTGPLDALSNLRLPGLKGLNLGKRQYETGCVQKDENTFECACEISGSVTIKLSGSETSGSVSATFNNCKDWTDEPALNGSMTISYSENKFDMTFDITQGDGFFYGKANATFTQSGSGGTIKAVIDFTGADYTDPADIAYVYIDETINAQNISDYVTTNDRYTINATGGFGTTKKGRVDFTIDDVVFDMSKCEIEPVSGTITVSSGSASVTVSFDGAKCDGKATASGAYNGEVDITGGEDFEIF